MPSHLLCENRLKVILTGSGDEALLKVEGDHIAEFWCRTADLDDALAEIPVQLSSPEGYLKIVCENDVAHMEFSLQGGRRSSCDFPVAHFRRAIESLRQRASA